MTGTVGCAIWEGAPTKTDASVSMIKNLILYHCSMLCHLVRRCSLWVSILRSHQITQHQNICSGAGLWFILLLCLISLWTLRGTGYIERTRWQLAKEFAVHECGIQSECSSCVLQSQLQVNLQFQGFATRLIGFWHMAPSFISVQNTRFALQSSCLTWTLIFSYLIL